MDKNKIRQVIAQNIRTIANQQQLSTTELANRSQLSQGTISKILNGGMQMTIPVALSIANALKVTLEDILHGVIEYSSSLKKTDKEHSSSLKRISIGILSIHNQRFTCIKSHTKEIIGMSQLENGLDLAETSGHLLQLIFESIEEASPNNYSKDQLLKEATLNVVMQSYEFEETRSRFISFAKKSFSDIILLPDWQISYLADFQSTPGISLVMDKGVSLSFMHNGNLKKLGGWKFPVYDLGGENWLGVETIRHTIEAFEGYIPMTKLAQQVLAKFNGKIEKITETCFKGSKDADIYCLFADILLRCYYLHHEVAKNIIQSGFEAIFRLVQRVDTILEQELKIAIHGSLADIYKPFFNPKRLTTASTNEEKVKLLADLSPILLKKIGIKMA